MRIQPHERLFFPLMVHRLNIATTHQRSRRVASTWNCFNIYFFSFFYFGPLFRSIIEIWKPWGCFGWPHKKTINFFCTNWEWIIIKPNLFSIFLINLIKFPPFFLFKKNPLFLIIVIMLGLSLCKIFGNYAQLALF